MKKVIALVLALLMVLGLAACGGDKPGPSQNPSSNPTQGTEPSNQPTDEKKTVAFVGFGSGGFFDMLADTYKKTMEAEGWEALYTSGEFNPSVQITAAENYISMDVDVLAIWSVAPEAMSGLIDQAMAKGIKVIAFVAPTEKYDAVMVSDDAEIASYCAKLAAKWVDETYADQPDGSLDVAVFTCRAAETGVVQGDVLLTVAQYSSKIGKVTEVECEDEAASTALTKMENLYTTNPEIKLFLSAHNGLAQGINNFYTGINSPVTDYSDMGIFCINGEDALYNMIKDSTEGKSPLRGTVMTGSVQDTANELRDVIVGLTTGTLPSGHVQKAGTALVFADTITEWLETGKVTSITAADLDK